MASSSAIPAERTEARLRGGLLFLAYRGSRPATIGPWMRSPARPGKCPLPRSSSPAGWRPSAPTAMAAATSTGGQSRSLSSSTSPGPQSSNWRGGGSVRGAARGMWCRLRLGGNEGRQPAPARLPFHACQRYVYPLRPRIPLSSPVPNRRGFFLGRIPIRANRPPVEAVLQLGELKITSSPLLSSRVSSLIPQWGFHSARPYPAGFAFAPIMAAGLLPSGHG